MLRNHFNSAKQLMKLVEQQEKLVVSVLPDDSFCICFNNNLSEYLSFAIISNAKERITKSATAVQENIGAIQTLQGALFKNINSADSKKLFQEAEQQIAELASLIQANSKVITQDKLLLPNFKLDFLEDSGSKPLTDLTKHAIRRNKIETIEALLEAGADPGVVGRELMGKRLGYAIPKA